MPLPYTFANGTRADATQVNANFQYLANAISSGGGTAVAVTKFTDSNLSTGVSLFLFQSSTVICDSLSQFDAATGVFTAAQTGFYRLICVADLQELVATTYINSPTVFYSVNGSAGGFSVYGTPLGVANISCPATLIKGVSLIAGDTVQFGTQALFSAGTLRPYHENMTIERIA